MPATTCQERATNVDIHDVDIDHVNVKGSQPGSTVQGWVALTPLLTVLITAIGLVFSFCFQIVQTRTAAREKVDSDWRAALEKATGSETASGYTAFEIESFQLDKVYGKNATSIAVSLLPTIKTPFQFDVAFFGLLEHTTEDDQDQVVSVARKLSLQLMRLRKAALASQGKIPQAEGAEPLDPSVANFVLHPERFYAEADPALEQAETTAWELDTASAGLSSLWHGTKERRALKPGSVDLSGVILANQDFSGIDFREASMSDTVFAGHCKVDRNKLPAGAPAPECESDAKGAR
jgi:hypothetical protein